MNSLSTIVTPLEANPYGLTERITEVLALSANGKNIFCMDHPFIEGKEARYYLASMVHAGGCDTRWEDTAVVFEGRSYYVSGFYDDSTMAQLTADISLSERDMTAFGLTKEDLAAANAAA